MHGASGRLYESSRAVNMVDGLPRAPSRGEEWSNFFMNFDQKNGHSSKSVNSFDTGPIF